MRRAFRAAMAGAGAAAAATTAAVPSHERSLGHEFLLKQACTANAAAADQLLLVLAVAVEDLGSRLRDARSREIAALTRPAETGDEDYYCDLPVETGSDISEIERRLKDALSHAEDAERLATIAARLSHLAGNVVASDAVCQRIEQFRRVRDEEATRGEADRAESLSLRRDAIDEILE